MESMNGITGNSGFNPRKLADLDNEGVRVEWQQETLTTNSNPYLLGVCGDIDTKVLTCVRQRHGEYFATHTKTFSLVGICNDFL